MFDWKIIDEKKVQLDGLRPFPQNTLKSLQKKMALEWTYHSNAIEGNTLTLKETKVALEGITIGGKSVKEHLEAINHNEAIQYLYKIIQNKESLNESQIKKIHSLILKKIDQINAGVYRKENVLISGAKHIPPNYTQVPNEMKKLINHYKTQWKSLHTLERSAFLHIDFVKIHPFVDGNGRISRLLQNFELMKEGFPPIIIQKENRLEYYDALDKAHITGQSEDFLKLSLECLDQSLNLYLKIIKQKEQSIRESKTTKNNKQNNIETSKRHQSKLLGKESKNDKFNEESESIRPSFREDESSQIPALQLLQNMGWTYLTPEEALKYRKENTRNILLEEILESQLRKINKIEYKGFFYEFQNSSILNAVCELKTIPFEGLVKTSEKAFDLITLGNSYMENIRGDRKSYDLKYIDWELPENNVYHVTDEYSVETSDDNTRRPDIVLFINGIPIVVIECKRTDIKNPIAEAISQHIRNQKPNEIPRLFIVSQILISLCPSNYYMNKNLCMYGTTGTDKKFWYPWREKSAYQTILENLIHKPLSKEKKDKLFSGRYNDFRKYFDQMEKSPREITHQDIILYGLCQPERTLEFIKKFTVYDSGTKKIARYQQYFSVIKTLQRITSVNSNQKRPNGVIWHTQGSGKSLSMVMLAKAIAMEPHIKEPKVILVTDRVNLDSQIYKTFQNCQVPLKRAKSGSHLVEILKSNKAAVIATTIFKFDVASNAKGIMLDSNDIIVLVDEAHRTQYNLASAKMDKVLPNACFIAYTGTPLTKKEKHTMKRFGKMIGFPYTSCDALEDKAIVPLLYEGRLVPQDVNKKMLDKMFERITKDLSDKQKADLKQKYNQSNQLSKTDQRIFMIATDISSHFSRMWKGFKGQLVANSISSALKYKKYFDQIGEISASVVISRTDDRKDHSHVVEEETDLQKYEKHIKENFGNHQNYEKQTIAKFDSEDEPDILIVVNKLLTGFDVPRNTVLYVDKAFEEKHTLLQATARVNRIYSHKEFGYVIDYHGNLKKFLEAIEHYNYLAEQEADADFDIDDREEIQNSIRKLTEEIKKLPQYYEELISLFISIKNKQDPSAYENELSDQEKREHFYKKVSLFGNYLHQALSSSDFITETSSAQIKKYKEELRFFSKLKHHIQEVYAESIDYRDYEPKIENLLNTYVQAEEVRTVVPLINIYDKEFNQELKGKKNQSKALMILHRTRKYISENMEKDHVFYEKLSKLLQKTLKDYKEKRIHEKELLEKAINLKNQALTRTGDDLPSSLEGKEEAKAFFGILKRVIEKGEALNEKNINKLVEMSIKISQIIEKHRIVDWFKNTDIQNRMKNEIEDYMYEQKNHIDMSIDFDSMDCIMEETIKTATQYDRS